MFHPPSIIPRSSLKFLFQILLVINLHKNPMIMEETLLRTTRAGTRDRNIQSRFRKMLIDAFDSIYPDEKETSLWYPLNG